MQPEIKKLDDTGIEYFVSAEGCKLKPYRDDYGHPTIGIGNTYYENGKRVTMKDPAITRARAVSLFRSVVGFYEQGVWTVTRDDIKQNQFNGLVSLAYNIGMERFKGSTVLRLVNKNPNDRAIIAAFKMWNKGTNKITGKLEVSKGLTNRRVKDAVLYFQA